MTTRSWIRKIFTRPVTGTLRRQPVRALLGVLPLEDRLAPATFTVNSLLDTNTGSGNSGTLRYCIGLANTTAGADTITFSTLFNSPQTITLGGTQLMLSDTTGATTITGPGANLLSISGNNASRVFNVNANVTATISGVRVTNGNVVDSSGGGIVNNGTLTVTNSTLNANSASGLQGLGGNGGGIRNNGTLTVMNTTLSGNSAALNGGGIDNPSGTLTVTNSTLSGNYALTGGGIHNTGTLTLTNSTLSGNTGGSFNSGIRNEGTLNATNSIIVGNSGVDVSPNGINGTNTNNLVNMTATAAGLGALGNYGGPTRTIPLLPGSPAINAGGSTTLTLDQRGQSRVGTVDIGAFESQGFTLAPTGSGQSTPIDTNFANPLAVAVTANATIEPVNGGRVIFTPPVSGASAVLSASTVTVAGGSASVTATANGSPGVYNVVVSASGAGSASFALTNAEGPPLVVSTAADVVNNADGVTSLREAINFANANPGADTITFSSLFNSPQTITLGGTQLMLSDATGATTISGRGANLLSISGSNASRVFNVNANVTATITGVRVTNGNAVGGGGGGIVNNGTLTVTNSTLNANSASNGGGIRNNGTLTVMNTTLSGNSADFNGGGIDNLSGTLTVTNSTLSGNSAINGGGINNSGTLTVTNSTLSGNSAINGGGIRNDGTLNATNSIIVGNTTGDVTQNGINGVNTNNLVNMTATAAGLGTLANYGGPTRTIPLLPGSPAINAGTASGAPTHDQRGKARVGGVVDIGAFESQGFTVTATSGTPQSTVTGTAFALPLVATVTANYAGEPVIGAVVTFTAPVNGASVTPDSQAITVDANGQASFGPLTANGTIGQYTVTATSLGSTANFALTNTETPSLVVNTTIDNSTSFDGLTSLREAIAYANSKTGADTITFSSLFNSSQTITLGGTQLMLSDTSGATTISGPGANLLSISGKNASRVFNVNALVTATISGARVTNGNNVDGGGGILNYGTLTVTNSTISGNSDGYAGGGILNIGTLTVTNSDIHSNSAGNFGFGGGIVNFGTLTVTNSNIFSNSVGKYGGGIHNTGTLTVTNSIIVDNSAVDNGGGIFNDGELTVTNSTIVLNTAGFYSGSGSGGGIHNHNNGTLTLRNSTLWANTAESSGGGIHNNGTLTLRNSTLSGNSADSQGGGIRNSGMLNATNSIIVGNTNGDVTQNGINGTNANNLVNMTASAAGLGTLGNYGGPTQTIPLLPGSPAINAGTSTGAPTTDQRGLPRFGAVDIGAFERQATPAVTGIALNTTTLTPANVGPSGFTVTATFNGAMDTSVQPLLSFPVEPINGTLTFNSSSWINSTQWVTKYDVANSGVNLSNIDIRITGGKNLDGTTQTQFDAPNAFNIAMQSASVSSFVVNDGAVQRSRLTKIVVNFANPVNAATLAAVGGITLTRTAATSSGTVGTIVNASNGLTISTATGMVSSVTLTFANVSNAGVENGSLADGRWRLAIPSLSYQSTLNDPTLRRIFGDADNNGTVDGSDFSAFGNAFGSTVAGSPYDADNNGTIDGSDFAQFGNRFGLTL